MTPSTIAPTDLIDQDGNSVEAPFGLSARTVVYFMRTADCPVCQKHVRELADTAEAFANLGTSIIVVVPDGVAEAKAFHASINAPFPIVTSSTLHDAAGFHEKVFGQLRQSGVLLVDATGAVLFSNTATLPPRAMNITKLQAAVEAAAAN